MKIRKSVFVVGIILLLSGMVVLPASAATWYVDDSGGADFTTIQAAVDASNAGDTVIVRDGTYVENVVVNKWVTIASENGPGVTTVLPVNTSPIFTLTANYSSVSGFTVKGPAPLTYDPEYVSIPLSNGIDISKAYHCTVTGNTALGCAYGIHIGYMWTQSGDNTVSGNNCSWNRDHGIKLDMTSGNIVSHNTCRGTWHDDNIDLTSSTNNIVTDNHCIDGLDAGIFLDASSHNLIMNNTCENNADTGIHDTITGSSNILSNNSCRGNSLDGIFVAGAGDTVTNNTLSNNGRHGIWITGSGAAAYLNNLVGNGMGNARGGTGSSWNSTSPIPYTYNGSTYEDYLGNYYSDYTGVDTSPEDGIGDTPYDITGSTTEKDYRPLMTESGNYLNEPQVPIAPVANFTSDVQTGTVPLTVNFTDTSTGEGINSWAWDVNNDGVVEYPTQNATHTFAAAGLYTVNLTVSNAGGSNTTIKTDYINVTAVPPPHLDSIAPKKHRHNGKTFTATVTGTGFQPKIPLTNVTLKRGTKSIKATNVNAASESSLTCSIKIPKNAKTGFYSVTMTNPDGQQATVARMFKVLT
jgi:parallel beta-helix repeat protein